MEMKKETDLRKVFAVFYGDVKGNFLKSFEKAFDGFGKETARRCDNGEKPVLARVFLSDIINQMPLIRERIDNISAQCAVSVIEQPPLKGGKIVIMACFLENASVECLGNDAWIISRGGERFIYQSLRFGKEDTRLSGGYEQTVEAFERHKKLLEPYGMTIEANTLRTWLFCRDIDRTYGGVVKGRNDFFALNGLTADTHFIASTGIGGYTDSPDAVVGVDFLSRMDGSGEDVKYLQALDHLNPTAQYGVAFERGTSFSFGSHRVALISGTASIDKFGKCINTNNPEKQTERLIENIGALLADDAMTTADIGMIIVYLRDVADKDVVESVVNRMIPGATAVFTHAKVCRPAWLVEAECVAVK